VTRVVATLRHVPRLSGRTALVLGGGQGDPDSPVVGIGYATATTFGLHGAAVVVVDRDGDAAERTVDAVRQAGGRARAVVADVTVADDVERAVAEAAQAFGRIDVLHNNVGVARLGGPEELTLDEWRATFAVNLDSVFLGVQKALPHLLERGGSIVNVSSTGSIRWTGYPYPAYAAAKAAVVSLTRSADLEGAAKGIRVNAVLPGAVNTPMLWNNPNVKSGLEKIDRGVLGEPDDLAAVITFLASDAAEFVRGASVVVDGGRLGRL